MDHSKRFYKREYDRAAFQLNMDALLAHYPIADGELSARALYDGYEPFYLDYYATKKTAYVKTYVDAVEEFHDDLVDTSNWRPLLTDGIPKLSELTANVFEDHSIVGLYSIFDYDPESMVHEVRSLVVPRWNEDLSLGDMAEHFDRQYLDASLFDNCGFFGGFKRGMMAVISSKPSWKETIYTFTDGTWLYQYQYKPFQSIGKDTLVVVYRQRGQLRYRALPGYSIDVFPVSVSEDTAD